MFQIVPTSSRLSSVFRSIADRNLFSLSVGKLDSELNFPDEEWERLKLRVGVAGIAAATEAAESFSTLSSVCDDVCVQEFVRPKIGERETLGSRPPRAACACSEGFFHGSQTGKEERVGSQVRASTLGARFGIRYLRELRHGKRLRLI